jgi:hypothetical protein
MQRAGCENLKGHYRDIMKRLTHWLILAICLPTVGKATTVLTFDDLPVTQYYGTVPNGYGGLQWSNFGIIQPQNYPENPGGYLAGMISSPNVAYNGYVNSDGTCTGSFYDTNGVFDLDSAYLTAAWGTPINVRVQGLIDNTLVYNNLYTVNETTPTFIQFNYTGIDTVNVISYPSGSISIGDQVAFDNIAVNVPEPECATVFLFGITLFGIAALPRRNALKVG